MPTNPTEPDLDEPSPAERAHLDRDRWPEFERELRARRPRRAHFRVLRGADQDNAPWEWLVMRCRTRGEVERVLNRYRVDWELREREVDVPGARIVRCS